MNAFIILLVGAGFFWYLRLALTKKNARIEEFFLAGRNIGNVLFSNTTWSNSLGFGNSMFVAIWGGYQWGLSAIWIQAIWALGMILYARLIPHILVHTDKFTLHGFLGSSFGDITKNVAAAVSLTGLLVCVGFEISFIGDFFASTLGYAQQGLVAVGVFAILLATFCSVGGYQGNVVIDIKSNRIASFSMLLWLILLVTLNPQGFNSIYSEGTKGAIWSFLTPNMSKFELIGFSVFTLFQLIDMTNWQSVSANALPRNPNELAAHIKGMRHSLRRTAIWFMLFPATCGSFIGYYVRHAGGADIQQADLLTKSFSMSIPAHPVLFVLFSSILLFGFLSSSLACGNSWLLAMVQTLSWDLIDFRTLKAVDFKVAALANEEHERITRRAKMLLYVVGAGGAAVIYAISKAWPAIFSLQFMMFGAGLSMLPSVIYAAVVKKTATRQRGLIGAGGFLSILLGFLSAIGMFVYATVAQNPDVSGMIPPVVLVVSTAVFLIFLGADRAKPQQA